MLLENQHDSVQHPEIKGAMEPTPPHDLAIFSGSGSLRLTQRICDYLEVPRGLGEVIRFSEGNLFVRVGQNVRGRHVYVVQSRR